MKPVTISEFLVLDPGPVCCRIEIWRVILIMTGFARICRCFFGLDRRISNVIMTISVAALALNVGQLRGYAHVLKAPTSIESGCVARRAIFIKTP